MLNNPSVLHGHLGTVCALAFLPDGALLSVSYDGTIRKWDVASLTQVAMVGDPKESFEAGMPFWQNQNLAVSPDGSICVYRNWVIDLVSMHEAESLPLRDTTAELFLSDPRYLAFGTIDGQIGVFDRKVGRTVWARQGKANHAEVCCLSYMPKTNRLLTGGLAELPGLAALERGLPARDAAVKEWLLPELK
jgi:WD40 repeat protein